jgi:hypothetical protein
MADITNQQLLEALTAQLGVITDQMVTKDDLKRELENFVTKDDLKREIGRLDRKLDSHKAINIKHHLETRKMIADLDSRFTNLREGLARAAAAA